VNHKAIGGWWRRVSVRTHLVLPLSIAVTVALMLSIAPWALKFWRAASYWEVAAPFLGLILALSSVWVVVDHQIGRWMEELRRLTVAFGAGDNLPSPWRLSAPAEIGDIAAALMGMADAIAARDLALKDSLLERDDLLREIHHRVKNNLQVISSLLSLQQRALSDPAARAAMSDTRQRITALALIYRALYEGPDLRKVDLRSFLEELIAQLIMYDGGTRSNIRTDFVINDLTIDPDHLAPLALFAVEAITNAKKHGLAESGGYLIVTFRVRGSMAELAITDSGVPGRSPAVVGAGVGRTLMLAFARQLGGDANFSPEPGGGMTARLSFPTPVAAVAR
jgi:two-component sensor histidine kinase